MTTSFHLSVFTSLERRCRQSMQRAHATVIPKLSVLGTVILGMVLSAQVSAADLSSKLKVQDNALQLDIYKEISDLFYPFVIDYLNAMGDVTPLPDAYSPEFGDTGYYDTYYGAVDPFGERETLDEWLEVNGFLEYPHLVEHAEYINANDLGFGREMYCLDNGRSSCYVKNYLDPTGASTFAATVTMERMNSGSDSFVAFFVFDAAGDRINQIALDSEGPKSVPESCYACHGGYRHAGNPHGGQYLPFDIDALKDWPGHPTREAQLEDFRRLNRVIWADAQWYGPKDSLTDLIEGWYDGAPYSGTHYDSERLPRDSWFTDPDALIAPTTTEKIHEHKVEKFLYTDVYAGYCRLCHVAQDLDWQDAHAGDFARTAYHHICDPGNNQPRMPNAEVTFDKFNNDKVHRLNNTGGLTIVGNLSVNMTLKQRLGVLGLSQQARVADLTAIGRQVDSSKIGGFQYLAGDTARDMLCEKLPLTFPAGNASAGGTKFNNTCSGCHWFSNADADYFNKPGGSLRCRGAWLRQELGSINGQMAPLTTLSYQEMQNLHEYLNSPQECP